MFKGNCEKCGREFTSRTEFGLKIALSKHGWYHEQKGPDWQAKAYQPAKVKRKYTKRNQAVAVIAAKEVAEVEEFKTTITKDQTNKIVAEVFSTLTCCPGCGRNLYAAYMGLRRATEILKNNE